MLFNSLEFVLLLLVTFVFYYIPQLAGIQILILILSSFIFYAYAQPMLLLLLLCSALVNILASYSIVNGAASKRKLYATLGVGFNIFILAFFKYNALLANIFIDTNNGVGNFLAMIPLPIGISFYTFEGISLLADVYSNKHADKLTISKSLGKHTTSTLFFISFFPHLIAGPVLKAYEFYPQIGIKYFKNIDWEYVFKKLTLGYFFKMVVADNLSNFTFWMQSPFFKMQSTVNLIAMLLGYSFQIFADFAGYSLLALGLAKLFGYDLPENFNFPYISTALSEFWRRWHISLSTFLKEYLYFPLGGSKKGTARTFLNLSIVMILSGLWHGAAWSFAVLGIFHGLALALEIVAGQYIKITGFIGKYIRWCLVFSVITCGWLLFRFPIDIAMSYLHSTGSNIHLNRDYAAVTCILLYSLPVIIYHLLYLYSLYGRYTLSFKRYQYLIYGFLLFMIMVNSAPSILFIYFQF
jgi:alginate O-acetyltransferase complex protein AlgI